jgi:hypothetical protein
MRALPDLSANINIAGPGSSDLTVARSSAAGTNSRIFTVPIGGVVTISGMTITGGFVSDQGSDGNASGGGIENSGTLSITDFAITANTAGIGDFGGVPGEGGGIENSGMLSIADATISTNTAANVPILPGEGAGGFGGGINNTGTLAVVDTAFSGNSGVGSAGAILNSGTLSVTDCSFAGNTGGGYTSPAGAIGNSGSATVSGSTFTGNTSYNGGGGISNSGTFSLTSSTLADNTAINNVGGGINNSGTMSISTTTFTGNSNQGAGGAIDNSGGLTVSASTFADNSAISSFNFPGINNPGDGGGIDNGGTLSITNTTFNGNFSSIGNTDQGGSGGAIFNSGTLSVTYVTMADNSVSGDGSVGGGIAISAGSNIAVMSIDSIFDNPEGGNISGGSDSNFQSLGHNLFSDNPGVPLDPTDLFNVDPRLGPLAANGGPTQTMALLPGSPAIDAGIVVSGVTTDQRGITRPQGSAPDIGAFESRGFVLTIVSGQDLRTQVGSAFAGTLVVAVLSPFGEPVAGGLVTFTAPVTGAAADFVSATAIIGSNGRASTTALANGFRGNYSVTIAAAGANNTVAVSLTNEDPTVVSLQRFGVHYYPTRLVLTFSEAMNATPADNLANYHLAVAVPDHRPGVEDGRTIRIRRALYDAANQPVTLWPIRRLPLRRTFLLTVKGAPPAGLTNASGTFLAGAGTGQPGSDYIGIVNRKSLAIETRRHNAAM